MQGTTAAALIATVACYGTVQPGYGHDAEVIRRMQRRDDILGILLPVLAALLLFLMLIVMRQRRSGLPVFEGAIRRWGEFIASARATAAASSRRSGPGDRFELLGEDEAEQHARRDRKILAEDGTVLLYVGQSVRIQADDALHEGTLYDIEENGLTVAPVSQVENVEIPWKAVRRMEARFGRERRRSLPWALAVAGAGALGACGAFLDAVDRATAVVYRSKHSTEIGAVLGAIVGYGVGSLVMHALPGPRWRLIAVDPDSSAPISLDNLAERASATFETEDAVEGTPREEVIARIVIVLIAFGFCAVFRRAAMP
jgi:hypothetical protein